MEFKTGAKTKFLAAKVLIEEGHKDLAGYILETVDHSAAQKLLRQLGKSTSPRLSKNYSRGMSAFFVIVLIVVFSVGSFFLGRVSAPLDLADQVRNELLNSLNTDPSDVDPLQSTDDVSAQGTQTAIAIFNDALRTQATATQNSISPELAATATAAASGKVAP